MWPPTPSPDLRTWSSDRLGLSTWSHGWFRIRTRPFPFGMAGIFRPVILVSGGVLIVEPGQKISSFLDRLKAVAFSESPGTPCCCPNVDSAPTLTRAPKKCSCCFRRMPAWSIRDLIFESKKNIWVFPTIGGFPPNHPIGSFFLGFGEQNSLKLPPIWGFPKMVVPPNHPWIDSVPAKIHWDGPVNSYPRWN